LNNLCWSDALGPAAQGGGPVPGEYEQQNENGPRSAAEVEKGAPQSDRDQNGETRQGGGSHAVRRSGNTASEAASDGG
jgi:hypothetical protein